jgi:hypothetical protein
MTFALLVIINPRASAMPKGLCPPAQGSSYLATLGFEAESLWDSSFLFSVMNGAASDALRA